MRYSKHSSSSYLRCTVLTLFPKYISIFREHRVQYDNRMVIESQHSFALSRWGMLLSWGSCLSIYLQLFIHKSRIISSGLRLTRAICFHSYKRTQCCNMPLLSFSNSNEEVLSHGLTIIFYSIYKQNSGICMYDNYTSAIWCFPQEVSIHKLMDLGSCKCSSWAPIHSPHKSFSKLYTGCLPPTSS